MRKNIFGLHFLVAVAAFAGVACKKDVTGPINQWTDSSTTSLVRLMPFGKLSQWRDNMAVVATGSKLIFAGGSNYVPQGDGSYIEVAYATVDIYDKITQTWTTASLSKARIAMAAIAHEDKVYFAGGVLGEDQG